MATDPGAVWREQGISAAQQGMRGAAKAALAHALVLNAADDEAWFWLAAVQTDPHRAMEALEHALAHNPGHPGAQAGLAALREELGLLPLDDGTDLFAPLPGLLVDADTPPWALGAAPESPPAPEGPPVAVPAATGLTPERVAELIRLGIAAAQEGRRLEARAALLAVVAYQDRDPAIWYWLGRVLDDPEDIQVALENCLQLDPNNRAAALALARFRPDEPAPRMPEPWLPPLALPPGGDPGLVGRVCAGHYRILAQFPIAGAAMFLALDTQSRRYVVFQPALPAAAPGGSGPTPTFAYNGIGYVLVDEALAGITLPQLLDAVQRFPLPEAVRYGLGLVEPAGDRPRRLLASRSWDPQTITLGPNGRLVLDVPEARPDAPLPPASVLSPPEHARGGPIDERSDVYLVAALIYYLATGSPPPPANRMPVPLPDPDGGGGHRGLPPRPVALFPAAPDLSPHLSGVLALAMQADPAARFPTLAQFAAALTQVAGEQPGGRPGPAARRGLLLPLLTRVALATVLVVVIFVGILVLVGRPSAEGPAIDPVVSGAAAAEAKTPTPTATAAPAASVPGAPSASPLPPGLRVSIDQIDARNPARTLVYLRVLESGRSGAPPVSSLDLSAFQVERDGTPLSPLAVQPMRVVSDAFSLFLVVDTGDKMAGAPIVAARTALAQFVQQLAPGTRVGLIAGTNPPQVLQDLTTASAPLLAAIAGLQAGGPAAPTDALWTAVDRLRAAGGRGAVVLLSAGRDTVTPQHAAADVIQLARQPVIPIDIAGLDNSFAFDRPTLYQLADQTGGIFVEGSDAGQLSALFRQLTDQMQGQYRLSLPAPQAGAPNAHTLVVRVQAGALHASDSASYGAP